MAWVCAQLVAHIWCAHDGLIFPADAISQHLKRIYAENERAVQFRKWANQIVKDYTIQGGVVMDVNRLKSGGSVLSEEFFER